MDRTKYLSPDKPLGGLHPPFSLGGAFYLLYDAPDNIAHSEFLVQLALLDCSSENPFQDLGVTEHIIFNIDRDSSDSRTAIERVFNEFSDRFDLQSIDLVADPEEGKTRALVGYEYKPFHITKKAALLVGIAGR